MKNNPPPILPDSWGLSLTGLFDFSLDSDQRDTERSSLSSDLPEAPAPETTSKYQPQGALVEVVNSRAGELVVSGPAGTGKSRACLEKLYRAALDYPGMRALILRKTRESVTQSALVTFETFVLPKDVPWVVNQKRRVRQSYELPNGSEIVVGGLDKTEKIFSTEYDLIYVQEARELGEDEWEDLTTRLRNAVLPWQQIIGDTNPDAPGHWIKQRASRGQLRLVESRHEDNPTVYDAATGEFTPRGREYIAKLDRLTGVRQKRLRLGLWVAAENMVYDGYDPAVHVIDRFPIPSEWTRYLAIDFGYTNPFVCQWWAEDHDGRLYRYRELYGVQRLVRDWAHQIYELSLGERLSAVITDHDVEGRADLEQHMTHSARECELVKSPRRSTTPSIKTVADGIEAVAARLKPAGDGLPRLALLRDSLVERDDLLAEAKKPTCTEEEFESYTWDKARTQRYGEVMLEEPRKVDDHGMDALRYMVMHLDSADSARRNALLAWAGRRAV